MPCGVCGPFGCYVQCPWKAECRACDYSENPYGKPNCAVINPHISGYDKELERLSEGAARYNAHWRPTFNPNGFTPTGFM